MTLTTRVSLFFLATLAAILVAFSVTLYVLARTHLHAQADDRAAAILDTLSASAEVDPAGVEWDPHGRPLQHTGDGERWSVRAADGRVLDASGDIDSDSGRWRVAERRLEGGRQTPPATDPPGKFHPHITLAAAVSLEPAAAALNRLALVLVGTSVALWVAALFGGRWVCRRALAPLTRMASAARAMPPTDAEERLPVPGTCDELADLGAAFNGLLDRLREAFERQRRFTGEASHQLRTPLTAILGQAEVALRRDRAPDEYRRVLGSVFAQAGQMRQLVESLLFLARSDADARLPDQVRINLVPWVEERARAWHSHPRGTDIVAGADGEAWAVVHPALFGDLVDNLIDNALKYSPVGTPVVVRVGGETGTVWVEVEDRGCGIAADDRPHLFRPFYRSAEARRRGVPGVGLGLAVAGRLAAAFGGGIDVMSEVGTGSRFRVRLPAAGANLGVAVGLARTL